MLWIVGSLLLFIHPPLVRGVILSPCGSEGVQEVLAGQETRFTCASEGRVEWRLHYYDRRTKGENQMTSDVLATGDMFVQMNSFDGLFTADVINNNTTSIIVNTVNNRRLYNNVHFLNGSLECTRRDADNMSAGCGLHYVDPPQNVSCSAVNTSFALKVSCVIGSIYSSRGRYKCQLIQSKNNSENKTLADATMVTSPTTKNITKSEVKVSASCQFNTTLPPEEGKYQFYVSVSPGGQTLSVENKFFAVERPKSPTVSCSPHPYVLENTNITCTCNTTSLGQPEGYPRWIAGEKIKQEGIVREEQDFPAPQEFYYTQSLSLSEHGNTWLRCDIVWGQENITGNNYTASVGYAPKTSRLFFNGREQNTTINERVQVHLRCESDGRPTPNISIYNSDNDTVIWRNLSHVNHTFIARCEDTAMYICSAWNEFSSQSSVAHSYPLQLGVGCKPRSSSSTMVKDKKEALNFDVIAFPEPIVSGVWFAESTVNRSELLYVQSSHANVSCESDIKHRYIFKCRLTVLSNAALSRTGVYMVQLTNNHGVENLTFEISYDEENKDGQVNHLSWLGFAAGCCFAITVLGTLILLIRKGMKGFSRFRLMSSTNPSANDSTVDEDHEASREAGVNYETPWDSVPLRMEPLNRMTTCTSRPKPCDTPLYAVVDKRRKKTSTRPVHIAGEQGIMEMNMNNDTQGVVESEYLRDMEVVYAVVDKVKDKTKLSRGQGQTTDTPRGRQTMNDYYDKDQLTEEDPIYVNNSDIKFKKKKHLATAQTNIAGTKNLPSPSSSSQTVNNGRWENDDGLIYVTPFFDVDGQVRRPLHPRKEEADYCTLRLMQTKMSASDSDSDH